MARPLKCTSELRHSLISIARNLMRLLSLQKTEAAVDGRVIYNTQSDYFSA